MKRFGILLALICVAPVVMAQGFQPAQTPPWVLADSYGRWTIRSKVPNTFTFPVSGVSPCAITQLNFGDKSTFLANSSTVTPSPVLIADSDPINSEAITPTHTYNSSAVCGWALAPVHPHISFSVQSATGGLQDAVNAVGSSTNAQLTTIVLTPEWYQLVSAISAQNSTLSAITPASIIANLVATSKVGLVDVTTSPWTFYTCTSSCAPSTVPIASQVTNPSTYLFVNGASIYAGTPDGTQSKPYITMGEALAAAPGAGPYAIVVAPGSYSDAGPIVGGTAQLTIYGNNSTWTVSGGITLNGPATVYDLNTVGNVTYAYTGATRSERHGGSFSTGNVVINGFVHWYGVQLTNTGGGYSVTVNGTLAGDFITGGMQIKSGGPSAFIALNNINLQKASGYNFDMTLGGVLALNGGYLTTVAGTANIYAPTANILATSHAVQNLTFVSGSGASFGSGTYYAYANLSLDPVGALGHTFNNVGSTSAHPYSVWYQSATVGPATAPSGSCTVNGEWVFSKDGHSTFCASGTWTTKI